MKTTIEVNRPYVHGSVQISWIGEVKTRLHVFSDMLTVNAVPVIIEGVIVRGQLDQWRAESFAVQRVEQARVQNNRWGTFKTSRRNQERAREVITEVVSIWAGGRPQPKPAPVYSSDDEGGLAQLLGSIGG